MSAAAAMSNDLAILSSHLSTLIEARSVSQNDLGPLVSYAIQETQDGRSLDTRKAQWESLLKNEVFCLAATEGEALKESNTGYYEELRSRLDMVLAFTEHDVCDVSFPFSILEDLLETQTVSSCWHIFSWMEERTERLIVNMTSTKGKSLILLRMLNDLLRRLSKTGKNTMLCGRILNFLGDVFPLGERSGVNLRGDYGTLWDGPGSKNLLVNGVEKKDTKDADVVMANADEKNATTPEEAKKEDFYQTFWSLQTAFSRPPLFSRALPFESFRKAVDTVLPVISEATKKERAMMGSKVIGAGLKRKRDDNSTSSTGSGADYFFAKFLTSPELLDLEIADTNFRRQFLFQLLILLQHLLQFTVGEKVKWTGARNRSLQMDFTLNTTDEKWCQDTWTRVVEEIRATTPGGKSIAETVCAILEREKNWIRWKNDTCPPFDKEPLQPLLEEQTRGKRQKMMEPQPPWRYRWGTEAITELWETGFHALQDCEDPIGPGDLKDYVKRIKQVEMRIELRKKQLGVVRPVPPTPKPTPAPVPAQVQATPQTTQTQEPTTTQVPVLAPVSVPTPPTTAPSTPLHPSLPPRPTASPAPKPNNTLRPPNTTIPQPSATANATQPNPATNIQPDQAKSPIPTPVSELPKDPQLTQLGEQKHHLSWLALRRTRIDYLHLFGKFGTAGVGGLAEAVEMEKIQESKEKEEKEKENEKDKGKEQPDEKEKEAEQQDNKMDVVKDELSNNEEATTATDLHAIANGLEDASKVHTTFNDIIGNDRYNNNTQQTAAQEDTNPSEIKMDVDTTRDELNGI
ncbi:hypothetical protein Clacol_006025 [Clathrus columnatus]|uniref:THO complex subunit 1 n=1 Tax=Clathrus columnatus TaxID=1419009 RepID=A0AAV5ADT7_9AGAM|nr:hypothetical protein Clacol_006025 [Clathrus columnatus]